MEWLGATVDKQYMNEWGLKHNAVIDWLGATGGTQYVNDWGEN